MTKRRKTKNSNAPRLTFQSLEPRQLLAGDVVGPHQAAGSLPSGVNLVQNGDFETVTPGADNFYLQSEVATWEAKGVNTQLNIFDYSAEYTNVLDLDSTAVEFDRVYQDIPTEANRDYLITFDFRSHPVTPSDATATTNDFEVWWGGELVAIYSGDDLWHTGTVKVRSGVGATTELLFCEVAENGDRVSDGVGALLDNIRVVRADDVGLVNGSFENANSETIFNRPWQVEGWGAASVEVADRWLKVVPSGTNNTDATEGQSYLNLDVTNENRDVVFSNVATTAGSSYYLSFDLRIDGQNSPTDQDELRVRWNGDWAGTFRANRDWQNYGLMLSADSSTTLLEFLELNEGDGSGPLIDNVKLYSIVTNDIVLDANGEADGTTGSAVHFPGAGAQNIGSEISLTHPSSNRISSATITLNGVVDGNRETIAVTDSTIPTESGTAKITVIRYRPETRQMQLIGEATAAEYEQVLRSLAYYNSKDVVTATPRSVSIEVFNNELPPSDSSGQASIDISVSTDQAAIDNAIIEKFARDNNLSTTPISEGVLAVIDNPGTGLNPTINSAVRVNYTGHLLTLTDQNKLVEGFVFDQSPDTGVTFSLGGVIRGWQLGIPAFKTGGSGKLLIPSGLAYGPFANGDIPANSVLVFDVELLQVIG